MATKPRGNRFKDVTGRIYGQLTVQSFSHLNKHGQAVWVCTCTCGKKKPVCISNLTAGNTISCGCVREMRQKTNRLTHGLCKTPEYKTWTRMLTRCFNKRNRGYRYYGSRGITISPRWLRFENFYRDMGPRPSAQYSIERKDNAGNYCKQNCKWATKKEQMRNRTITHFVKYKGRQMSLAGLCEAFHLNYNRVKRRLQLGWAVKDAVECPLNSKNPS